MIAISTGFKAASLAIQIGKQAAYKTLPSECKHSENILPTVDTMLYELNKNIQDNDVIAVVTGPGSFTGLRIGVALTKGICAAMPNTKTIALSSLELMAYSYTKQMPSQEFWCVLNALSDLRFIGHFTAKGILLEEPQLKEKGFVDSLTDRVIGLAEENIAEITVQPSAEDLLEFANLQQEKGNFCDYHTLAPVYLRKSQAEVSLEQKKLKF